MMWGLMAFGPQLHAFHDFLSKISPLILNGTFKREILTEIHPLFGNNSFVWAIVLGFVVGICYYFVENGLPVSKITIPVYDDLFPVVVASLAKLRQPSSVLVAAETSWRSDSDWDSDFECSDSDDESTPISTQPDYGSNLYWYKMQPMWVTRGFIPHSGGGNDRVKEVLSLTILSLFPKAMTQIVSQWYQEQQGKEISYTVIRETEIECWNPWQIKTLKPSRSLESVILPKEIKDTIIQDLENFVLPATRRWYTKRGYPYRRGHIYHGKPGTGKSTLANALAGHLKLELYVVPINNPQITQEALAKMFRRLHDPCMVLLEDIDALNATTTERGSSKTSQSGHISLSTLLNALDGVTTKEGIILIMTSNHLEAIDEALIRPGRIDLKVEFTNVNKAQLIDLFLLTYLSDTSEKTHNASATNNENIFTPSVNDEDIHKLAEQFSNVLPSSRFTVEEVQGYLFHHKTDPHGALASVAAWSQQDIEGRFRHAAKGFFKNPIIDDEEGLAEDISDD
ncbi:MAG: hypothetical protein Q9217_003579 [Psora testacea]